MSTHEHCCTLTIARYCTTTDPERQQMSDQTPAAEEPKPTRQLTQEQARTTARLVRAARERQADAQRAEQETGE